MGKGVMAMMDKIFDWYDIRKRFGKKIKEFVSDGVVFDDDSMLDSDLAMYIPAGTGPATLQNSELPLSDAGFVKTDYLG